MFVAFGLLRCKDFGCQGRCYGITQPFQYFGASGFLSTRSMRADSRAYACMRLRVSLCVCVLGGGGGVGAIKQGGGGGGGAIKRGGGGHLPQMPPLWGRHCHVTE